MPRAHADVGMGLGDRFRRVLRQQARKAGREYARSKRAYEEGREWGENHAGEFGLPTDGEDRGRVVCRRHAEKRAVAVNADGEPACFDEGHPDCEGCAEDVRDGRVQTW